MPFQAGQKKISGRKKGVPNKATQARQAEIAASGLTPLEYMLRVMRDEKASADRRDDMAKSAAPYVHPKLATVAHTGSNGGPLEFRDLSALSENELAALNDLRARLMLATGGTGSSGGD